MNHAVGRWLKVGVLTFVTAALVACAGAAGKPGEPGAPGAPGVAAQLPPFAVGTIGDGELEVGGAVRTVALAGYFSESEGETLTYTAASSAVAVATASVSASTLTVTAVAAGSAVITVTATDTDSLTATQMFNVTVTAAADPTDPTDPTTPTDPDTITISGKTGVEVDLTKHLAGAAAADHELESRDPSVFTVAKKAASTSVWVVSPKSFGTDKAEIIATADGTVVKTLTVTVENRPPEENAKATAPTLATLIAAKAHAPVAPAKPMKNENDDNTLNLYSVVLAAGAQFTDPDTADAGKLTYTITPGRQDVVVQDGGTCKTASCTVWIDIITRRISADEFDLNVVATDAAKATSAAVMFPIRMEPPAAQTYNVEQFKVTYNFRPVAVGYRAVTEHKLVFKHPDEDATSPLKGFLFAEALKADLDAIAGLADGASPPAALPDAPANYPVTVGTAPNALYGVSAPPALAEDDDDDGSISVYTVKATGRVSVAAMTKDVVPVPALTLVQDSAAAGMDATLAFTVSGVGNGTIEIGYHVWWDEDGDTVEGQDGAPDTGTKKAKWYAAKETLTVTVVAVD